MNVDRALRQPLIPQELHAKVNHRIHDWEQGTPAAELKALLVGFIIAGLSGALMTLLLLWACKVI